MLAGLLCLALGWERVRRDELTWQSPAGDRLRAELFLPEEPSGRRPFVLCVYSIYQLPEQARPLAEAFAANGVGAANLVLQAHSPNLGRDKTFEEYLAEVRAVLTVLRRRPDVGQLALYGHSMGADLVCQTASRDLTVGTTLASGFPVDAFPDEPADLLLTIGAWDELHPLGEMRGALRQATGLPDAREGVTYGPQGRRRRLAVLPLSNHAMELYDPTFVREAVEFTGHRAPRLGMPLRLVGAGLATLGATLTLIAVLAPLRWRLAGSGYLAERALSILLALSVLGLGLAHRAWPDALPFHRGMLCLLGAVALVNSLREPSSLNRGANLALRYAAALTLTGMATYALNAGGAILEHPVYLAWLPLFVLYALPVGVNNAAVNASHQLFHAMPNTTGIHPVLAGLLLLELLLPGRLWRLIAGAAAHVVHMVRRLDLRVAGGGSPAQMALLAVLLVGAGLAWRQTAGGGYQLGGAEMLRLGWLLFRLV
ncbi:MAG: hypothetical protein AB1758_36490, partial [Candidatus Eremiobacterota bacterium]